MMGKKRAEFAKELIIKIKKEHTSILEEAASFKKKLVRVGRNLDSVKGFVDVFDNRIKQLLELEENILFPYFRSDKEEMIFVMRYYHDILRKEFIRLGEALSEKNIYAISRSGVRIVDALQQHIAQEDKKVLEGAEKKMGIDSSSMLLMHKIQHNPSRLK